MKGCDIPYELARFVTHARDTLGFFGIGRLTQADLAMGVSACCLLGQATVLNTQIPRLVSPDDDALPKAWAGYEIYRAHRYTIVRPLDVSIR